MDTLGSRSPFLSILGSIWEASWESFWRPFWDLSMIWLPKWETVSRSVFLMIQSGKCCQNPVAVCAVTTIKTVVFDWFHFFHWFTDFVSRGVVLGDILESFGDLGETFRDIWGFWEQAWNLMYFQGFPGTPQVESMTPVGGNVLVQLGTKLVA